MATDVRVAESGVPPSPKRSPRSINTGCDDSAVSRLNPSLPPQPSLGSTLVASGIVRRPVSLASDPLAPIRRLSQAEKIALFS